MNQTEKKRLQKTLFRAIETLEEILLLTDPQSWTNEYERVRNAVAAIEQLALELQGDLDALGHDLGAFTDSPD